MITKKSKFIAANAQINASNMGHHSIDKYRNIDCLIVNETELRHEMRNKSLPTKLLMKKLARMELQVMPVIFFNDKIGRPQFIILDTWNDKYKDLKPDNISLLLQNQFSPLFAVTPGTDTVQFILSTQALETVYRFSLPYEKMGDYTKVTVKFMKENELDALLEESN